MYQGLKWYKFRTTFPQFQIYVKDFIFCNSRPSFVWFWERFVIPDITQVCRLIRGTWQRLGIKGSLWKGISPILSGTLVNSEHTQLNTAAGKLPTKTYFVGFQLSLTYTPCFVPWTAYICSAPAVPEHRSYLGWIPLEEVGRHGPALDWQIGSEGVTGELELSTHLAGSNATESTPI